jgi:hypothetical protein
VSPIIEPAVPVLLDALRDGIEYASELQAEEEEFDGYFWAHAARYRTKRALLAARDPSAGWTLIQSRKNSAIHLRFGDLHIARLLRSSDGTTPSPGRNRARRRAYTQSSLALAPGGLPPLSLIFDWQEEDGEPVLHVGLPKGTWDYKANPVLHWRHRLDDGGQALAGLAFDPGEDDGDLGVTIAVHASEAGEVS